jgi:dGTPase
MPCTREELEARERATLAPFAQFSADSRGRAFPEPPPEWRTQFQRDRDRIIHSRAFRRLEYKTQVFLNGTGDHLRTRLTHTMEVAAIARNIARALRLNEDLAEAIALAHDLGHSPVGHSGERVLNERMRRQGGFEHNRHSLRIVEELEQKYPDFPGLNLTWEVREGLAKHRTGFDRPAGGLGFDAKCSSLEAQVADVADEIAYSSHDLDDGLDAGLLSEARLSRQVRIWRRAAAQVRRARGLLADECRRHFTIRCLIDDQVRNVVTITERRLAAAQVRSADDVRRQSRPLVQFSPHRRDLNRELRAYLYAHLYNCRAVHGPNAQAVDMLRQLFRFYVAHPETLGEQARKRVPVHGLQRATCDYLAGMTDRYALQEYARLIGRRTAAAG